MVGMHAAFCSGTHSTPLSLCFFENHPNYTPYLGGFSGKHPNNTPCRHNFFGVKFVLFTDNVYFRKR